MKCIRKMGCSKVGDEQGLGWIRAVLVMLEMESHPRTAIVTVGQIYPRMNQEEQVPIYDGTKDPDLSAPEKVSPFLQIVSAVNLERRGW